MALSRVAFSRMAPTLAPRPMAMSDGRGALITLEVHMAERRPQPGDGWEDILNQACRQMPLDGGAHSNRRALSVLSDAERDELDAHLSGSLNADESEAMNDCLTRLEDLIEDRPQALELLEHVRQDIARTALRCIEQSYRFGKRRGHREALDLLLPYVHEVATSS